MPKHLNHNNQVDLQSRNGSRISQHSRKSGQWETETDASSEMGETGSIFVSLAASAPNMDVKSLLEMQVEEFHAMDALLPEVRE
jgi:hypothetical protein